jgi:hypothetical protein
MATFLIAYHKKNGINKLRYLDWELKFEFLIVSCSPLGFIFSAILIYGIIKIGIEREYDKDIVFNELKSKHAALREMLIKQDILTNEEIDSLIESKSVLNKLLGE